MVAPLAAAVSAGIGSVFAGLGVFVGIGVFVGAPAATGVALAYADHGPLPSPFTARIV